MKPRFLTLFFLFFCGVILYSQEQKTSPDHSVKDERPEKVVQLGIGGDLDLGIFAFIPQTSINLIMPLYFGEDVTLTPAIGFAYFLPVLSDYHSGFYLPAGADLTFRKSGLGVSARYYLALTQIFKEAIITAGFHWNTTLLEAKKVKLLFFLRIGMGIFTYSSAKPLFLPYIRPALSLRYRF